jgi:demethylmenaquinone methyltransferase / 2-methoxy-6-polyprenyl-1,4-benzoquinol methylase
MSEFKKKEDVRIMFDDISPRYDFLNHFLSLGIDKLWRRRLIRMLRPEHPHTILDVATGTGDLAIALAALKPHRITGIDIAEKMLDVARKKTVKRKLDTIIDFHEGDAEKIPFTDGSFDAVTVAFGVRNYEDLLKGLKEMTRVMKHGGTMLILEFSQPQSIIVKYLYRLYSMVVIPSAGKLISGNNDAYRYLPASVAAFPSGNDFLAILRVAGLRNCRQYPLTGGIASIYRGEK